MSSLNDVVRRGTSFNLSYGEELLLRNYGLRTSGWDKAKSLIKFGKSVDLDANVPELIWSQGGIETLPTGNTITHISSSSSSDTQEVVIEGHTVSGSGVDAQHTFVVQTLNLAGQTKTALSTPLARTSRMYNNDTTDLVGDVYVYEDDTVIAGVPQTSGNIHLKIVAGEQQTFKAATTFSNTDAFVLTDIYAGVRKATAAAVDFTLETAFAGKVFRERFAFAVSQSSGTVSIRLDQPIVVPNNTDIRILGESNTNNTTAYASFAGYIVKIL